MSTRWTEETRREWIRTRQKESAIWFTIHALGSLRLAMLLLITIALACAVATICESNFNTRIAQAYVYKAPWFVFWLALLCINLLCAALTRWPWQKKHAGFVITHGGIILLLVGAMIGQKLGFEANVTLHTGEPPKDRLILNRTILQVDSPADRAIYTLPFDPELRPPSSEKPRIVAIPNSELRLQIDGYSAKLARISELKPGPEGAAAGVSLQFQSAMMQQRLPVHLTRATEELSSHDFFKRARITLLDALPPREKAPTSAAAPVHRDVQVIFANHPDESVSHSDAEHPRSVFTARLDLSTGKPMLRLFAGSNATPIEHDVLASIGRPEKLPDGTTLTIRNYWPDFVMRDGKPVSASDQPNNPAALVEFAAINPGQEKEKPLLELAVTATGELAYQISRAGLVTAAGTVRPGDTFPLGWADWSAHVEAAMQHALLTARHEPATDPSSPDLPGIRARLITADEASRGEPAWIASGAPAVLTLRDSGVRIGYGLESKPMPFRISLEKFEVPRDEGTDTPANFIATVRFEQPATGITSTNRISMNHPASFPPALWQTALGRNYKFSQASWNPEDLGETTLQVLHDPGWPLKWIGSLMVSIGIAVLFYFKPRTQRRSPAPASSVPAPKELASTR
jgi:hypothetical protein